ncbi:MAG TPA: tripartite tricarboxylate transporter substrate-binding protein, partial [Xanthobacteraceae bacterium]|nr:tripartite tricarboxylate transporter substrate-binding protein [Xanthobacteraceae bacterium]
YSALVAGEVQVIASGLGAATPFLQSGQARALAALSSQRPASLPDVPTLAEAGYPDFTLGSWMGVFARSGTPRQIVDKLETEFLRALAQPDIKSQLVNLSLEPAPMHSKEFSSFFEKEIGNWAAVVHATTLAPQ